MREAGTGQMLRFPAFRWAGLSACAITWATGLFGRSDPQFNPPLDLVGEKSINGFIEKFENLCHTLARYFCFREFRARRMTAGRASPPSHAFQPSDDHDP